MYPALIGAGISQLYDLFKGQSGSTSSNFQVPSTTDATTGSTSSSSSSNGTGFGTDINRLFLDLQANSTGGTSSTSATNTVASDLKDVFGDVKKAGGSHHHHHAAQSATQAASQAADGSGTTDPLQSLASSLLAYAKTQNLTSSASTTSTTG